MNLKTVLNNFVHQTFIQQAWESKNEHEFLIFDNILSLECVKSVKCRSDPDIYIYMSNTN